MSLEDIAESELEKLRNNLTKLLNESKGDYREARGNENKYFFAMLAIMAGPPLLVYTFAHIVSKATDNPMAGAIAAAVITIPFIKDYGYYVLRSIDRLNRTLSTKEKSRKQITDLTKELLEIRYELNRRSA